ncbi:MAG TPA: hypothetical protein VNH17_08860 [Streptosporangiaceae bacterium]|nr:hypothetical protein [Streptosporangiaceae bacterium]
MRNAMRARRGLAAVAVLGAACLPISTLTGAQLAGAAPPRHVLASQARFPAPAGHRFAVLLEDNAKVIDMATGRVLRMVLPPDPHSELLWVAAAASDRVFVLASRPPPGRLRFSVLRISRDGRSVLLRPILLGRRLHGELTGLAVSPDGSRFAVSLWPHGTGPGPSWLWEGQLPRPGRGRLWVSRTATAQNPSWAGNRQLAFGWPDPAGGARPGLRIRGLTGGTPGTPASPLAGSRMIAPGTTRAGGQITADGTTILSVVVTRDGRARLDKLAPGSGHVRQSFPLAGPARPEARQDCAVIYASPSGHKIFTQCGQTQHLITGSREQRIHLALIVPSAGYAGEHIFAW